jgi:lysophospholipase L1-like esterase
LGLPEYEEKSVFELPFVYFTDPFLQFMIENADLLLQPDDPFVPTDPTNPTNPTDPTDPIDPTDPKPTDPKPTDPKPTDPKPTEPNPTEPKPTDPKPTEPQPTEPKPTEPKPTEPKPTEPKPTEPKPTDPPIDPNLTPLDPGFRYPSESVPEDWFNNTLFIGDSRIVGLRDYARFSGASYFCDVGMTVFSVWNKTLSDNNGLSDNSFSNTKLEDLFKSKKFDKIFINFGLNECGYPYSTLTFAYKQFLTKVRQLQPDAIIVLQGIMSVTSKKANQANYFQPSNLQKISNFFASLADGKKVFYIDVNEFFTDKNGYLLSGLTTDGCHPTATGYKKWKEWLAYAAGTLGV